MKSNVKGNPTMLWSVALAWCVFSSGFAAVGPDTPVATVNGEVITLRTLEDQLLIKEGKEAVLQLVEKQLAAADWSKIPEDAPLVAMGNWVVPRNLLAAQLVKSKGGQVRDDLINIALVDQALRADGMIVGQLLLQAEKERMERRFQAHLAEKGHPQIPFEQYIQEIEKMSFAAWMAQPGFRMFAGLHALVLRRSQVDEETLVAFHRDNQQLFGHPEQVRLGLIILDFELEQGPDGRPRVVESHRERLRPVAAGLYRQITTSDRPNFSKTWADWLGASRDPQAGPGGDIGWVGLDGKRSQPGSPVVPRRAVELAMAVPVEQFPKVLHPVEHAGGIVIVEVRERRPAHQPPFAMVANEVRRLYLETNMDEYSRKLLVQLRNDAVIDYEGLGRLIAEREAALKQLEEPGLTGE